MKLTKNWAKPKQHPEAQLLVFENYSLSSPALSSKNDVHISKNAQKCKCAHFHEIIWLAIINMKLKMKKRSYRSDI